MPHCALSSTGRYGGAATRPLPGDAIGNGAPRIADLITKRNCSKKHGTSRRRSWRKLHLGVDAESGEIVAIELTKKQSDDAARTAALLDQITDPVASFTADGAYDQDRVYEGVAEHAPDAAVIVPPRSTAVPSAAAETAPTQRDQHIQEIAEHGRMGWQKASGYNLRAKVEASIGRYKRVIGDVLRSRTDETEATDVAIALAAS